MIPRIRQLLVISLSNPNVAHQPASDMSKLHYVWCLLPAVITNCAILRRKCTVSPVKIVHHCHWTYTHVIPIITIITTSYILNKITLSRKCMVIVQSTLAYPILSHVIGKCT